MTGSTLGNAESNAQQPEKVKVHFVPVGRCDSKIFAFTSVLLREPTVPLIQKKNNFEICLHLFLIGSAPIMKRNKFQIASDQRFASVHSFLRRVLKLHGESLFLYCNSAFCPGPDELVGDLNDCFAKRGELIIHYSLQEAWG